MIGDADIEYHGDFINSSRQVVCLNDKEETYEYLWDDFQARPGIAIEYSRSYWLKECETFKNLF